MQANVSRHVDGRHVALFLYATSSPATALETEICGKSGAGYCLNDWGGQPYAGNPIKMYFGGYSNGDFYFNTPAYRCDRGRRR
jgi:hypothetical protein